MLVFRALYNCCLALKSSTKRFSQELPTLRWLTLNIDFTYSSGCCLFAGLFTTSLMPQSLYRTFCVEYIYCVTQWVDCWLLLYMGGLHLEHKDSSSHFTKWLVQFLHGWFTSSLPLHFWFIVWTHQQLRGFFHFCSECQVSVEKCLSVLAACELMIVDWGERYLCSCNIVFTPAKIT